MTREIYCYIRTITPAITSSCQCYLSSELNRLPLLSPNFDGPLFISADKPAVMSTESYLQFVTHNALYTNFNIAMKHCTVGPVVDFDCSMAQEWFHQKLSLMKLTITLQLLQYCRSMSEIRWMTS